MKPSGPHHLAGLFRIAEGREHNQRSGGEHALHLKRQLARRRHHPLIVFRPPLGTEKFPRRLLRLARIAVVTSGPNAAARWCGRTAGQESNRIRCQWENECASLLRSTDEPAPRHRRDRGDRRRGPAPIAPCPSVRAKHVCDELARQSRAETNAGVRLLLQRTCRQTWSASAAAVSAVFTGLLTRL